MCNPYIILMTGEGGSILIDIRNVSKSYNKGAVRAVDKLELRVERGRFRFPGAERRWKDYDNKDDSRA